MGYAITYARAQIGVDAPLVTVEADISQGLPQIQIVGLPETAVKEAKDRVKSAIINAGFQTPNRRVTINLAPADLPKQGGRYDLAIALSILAANGDIPAERIADREWLGELALNGELRGVQGVLPAAVQAAASHRILAVPLVNEGEAGLAGTANIETASHFSEIIAAIKGPNSLPKARVFQASSRSSHMLLDDVRGQDLAKRALTIAAAGGHNIIFIGPPGTGKTMLASRLASLLPALNASQALEVASIYSVSQQGFDPSTWAQRPFRAPHHTSSAVALVGGSSPPRPGEISLAHHGVLFLDELPEYPRKVLEVLREPLESGEIQISRAHYQVRYPARFQLVAAMNPCPCGYFGAESDRCRCSEDKVSQYRGRVSGPLMDRIDLHVEVPALTASTLTESSARQDNPEHREACRVISAARQKMLKREGTQNADLDARTIRQSVRLRPDDRQLLEHAFEKLGLSARGYFKVLRVARTIADLAGDEEVATRHLTEALGFRKLDRFRPA
ncbi:MAG: YifB family Mg chelatase-like AAA ATPase [Pseudomonadales bacterium]|nr:YifB family Mg chelatase-like AAA ATPase [Pseudomonadales bacterium]